MKTREGRNDLNLKRRPGSLFTVIRSISLFMHRYQQVFGLYHVMVCPCFWFTGP